jgi:hypothetical protein
MDEILLKKINEKISEILTNKYEIKKILQTLENLEADEKSFVYGIVIGRLYNSFYYQCRRILKRDPTSEEFTEFLGILKKHENEFLEKI